MRQRQETTPALALAATPTARVIGTAGVTSEQSPYTAELLALVKTLEVLAGTLDQLPMWADRTVAIITYNQSVLQALHRPARQSGQRDIKRALETIQRLRGRAVRVLAVSTTTDAAITAERTELKTRIKTWLHVQEGAVSEYVSRSTLSRAIRKQIEENTRLSPNVGKAIKAIDKALPGRHTKELYGALNKREARAVVQLRTGANQLNGYLYTIGAAESAQCECGANEESVKHYLFTCRRWDRERAELRARWPNKIGDLSFFLGGRRAGEEERGWHPDITAVRATAAFTKATARLEVKAVEEEQ